MFSLQLSLVVAGNKEQRRPGTEVPRMVAMRAASIIRMRIPMLSVSAL